jgi:hypothetical protein
MVTAPAADFTDFSPAAWTSATNPFVEYCARIRQNFYCTSCSEERRPYRSAMPPVACVRCSRFLSTFFVRWITASVCWGSAMGCCRRQPRQ